MVTPGQLNSEGAVCLVCQDLYLHVTGAEMYGHVVLNDVVVGEGDPEVPVKGVEETVEAAEAGEVGASRVVAAGEGCVGEVAVVVTPLTTVVAGDGYHLCGFGLGCYGCRVCWLLEC